MKPDSLLKQKEPWDFRVGIWSCTNKALMMSHYLLTVDFEMLDTLIRGIQENLQPYIIANWDEIKRNSEYNKNLNNFLYGQN